MIGTARISAESASLKGISHWPADRSQPLKEQTVCNLLRHAAATVPDRLALVDGTGEYATRRRWTYGELLHDAERVARALLTRFSPRDRIALLAANSAEWVLLEYGIALAGLVLVPINPAYGESEVRVIIDESGAAGLFFCDTYRGRHLASGVAAIRQASPSLCETVPFSAWEEFLAGGDDTVQLPQLTPDDVVIIQFTSGTTGQPKGASLHHRGVTNTSAFVAQRAGFPDGGVWINAMPLFHIAGSVVTLFGALSARGTYVVAPGFEPESMLELIQSERGNTTLIVPTMILAMLDHLDFSRFDVSSMLTILTGAAPVPAALATRAMSAFGCELSILFGQTELNGVVSQTRLTDSIEDQTETLGQPLPHAEVCIADPETGRMLPFGETGEIYVRGYQAMAGYHGLDEETRATIRKDGWLRTGDLALMDERGYLSIAGRLKDVIIRGGMNIYPREIEDVLFNHPSISQVSVVGLPDEKWGEIVAAVVVPANGAAPNPERLFEYCRTQLASHKAPVKWFYVQGFPLTPSGKVQKFVLVERIASGEIVENAWSRPQSR